jgi:hypothetical protein
MARGAKIWMICTGSHARLTQLLGAQSDLFLNWWNGWFRRLPTVYAVMELLTAITR